MPTEKEKIQKVIHLIGPDKICKMCGITRSEVLAKCHGVTGVLDYYYRAYEYDGDGYTWIPCIQADRNW